MGEDTSQTGSDYVLEALAAEGVSDLFGLIGEGNAHLLDALHEHPIRFRYARHEQVGVMMADGYARETGEVGVVTLTHGPGVTHGATGIACADRDGIPLVVLIGDTDIEGRERSLQYLDHRTFAGPISTAQVRVEAPHTLPETLRRAFDTARTRRGPVVVELPGDVQSAPAPEIPYEPIRRPPQRPGPDPDRVREAATLLEDAEAPAILAGGGARASGAGQALERLAERLGAPIATTFFGKGVLADDHPMVTGIAGTFLTPASEALLEDVDVLLAVGTALSGKTTRYGALYEDAAIVQIDLDPSSFGRHEEPAVPVVGDATAALEAIADAVEPRPERAERVRSAIEAAPAPRELPVERASDRIDPRELTVAIADLVPEAVTITVDSGNNTGFPPVFHPLGPGGRMHVNGNFGSMGYALPAALGAQLADPDRRVVCYTGDGALLQVIQDLETAVRLSLPVLIVVYNDDSYGIIRHRQALEFGRTTAASYESPSFVEIARGFGAEAVDVRSTDDLAPVERFLDGDRDRPMLVDARTIPEVSRPGFPPY